MNGCGSAGPVTKATSSLAPHLWVRWQAILGVEPCKDCHLGRAQLFGGPEFIESEIISRSDLLLDGALDIGVRERGVTPSRATPACSSGTQVDPCRR